MLRYLLIFMLLNSYSFAQEIEWNADRPLEWKDFKKKDIAKNNVVAWTHSGIKTQYKCYNNNFTFSISCTFDPMLSWTNTLNNDYILAHEQLHFDISEVVKRRINYDIKNIKNPCANIKNIKKIINNHISELKILQKLYDNESNHSMNREGQEKWQLNVKNWLKALDSY